MVYGGARRPVPTVLIAVLVLLVAGFALAAGASAHVKVSGVDATRGGYGVVTFRVPSESTTLSTTKLVITFPTSTPFVSAALQPKAGWRGKVIMKKLAKSRKDDDGNEIDSYVAQVAYTATSAASAIPPGDFDLFNISVGAFPDAPSVSFAALQTYSDGSIVNWDERSANGTEPEHPAPVLELAAAQDDPAGAGSASSAPSTGAPVQAASSSSTDTGLAVAGLAVAIVALLVASAVFVAGRRRPRGPAGSG